MQVDIEVCEQIFSWLSKYKKITQMMGESTFMFFLLYLCDLHNMHEEERLKSDRLCKYVYKLTALLMSLIAGQENNIIIVYYV